MMFGRKKKALAAYTSSLATLINVTFWPLRKLHGDELSQEVTTDKFILGYIVGVVHIGAHLVGFTEPVDKGKLSMQVLETFFPGQGLDLTEQCTHWIKSKDQEYLKAFHLGVEESTPYHKAQMEYMAGDEDTELGALGQPLHSLTEHLDRKYIQGSAPSRGLDLASPTTNKEIDELLKDSEDFGKFAQLIYRERRAAKSTIYTTWTLGIIVAVAGVIFYGWLWLWVLVVPVVVNALVVNNAYHRIARETGLDAMVVHQLWRQSKNIDAQIEQKR